MALVLLFLYIPIFVLIVFSFNVTKSRSVFSGFTFDWYIKLFHNGLIMKSLLNTVIVATVASIAATILGTAAAIGYKQYEKTAANDCYAGYEHSYYQPRNRYGCFAYAFVRVLCGKNEF